MEVGRAVDRRAPNPTLGDRAGEVGQSTVVKSVVEPVTAVIAADRQRCPTLHRPGTRSPSESSVTSVWLNKVQPRLRPPPQTTRR